MDVGASLLANPLPPNEYAAPPAAQVGTFDRLKALLKRSEPENNEPKNDTRVETTEEKFDASDRKRQQTGQASDPIEIYSDDDDVQNTSDNVLKQARNSSDMDLAETSDDHVANVERYLIDVVEEREEKFIGFDNHASKEDVEMDFEFGKNKRKESSYLERKKLLDTLKRRELDHFIEEITEGLLIVKERVPWFGCAHSPRVNPADVTLDFDAGVYRSKSPARLLHHEILDFCEFVKPRKEEALVRRFVIDKVTEAVQSLWPESDVVSFGSFPVEMYLPSSDLDVVVLNPTLAANQRTLSRLANRLKERDMIFGDSIQVIASARVPIVKFTERLSQIQVDISFNVDTGIRVVRLVRHLIRTYPALKPLVLLLKQFLLIRGLNEVFSGGLGSFGLMNLVTSFLQMHPKIQSGEIDQEDNLGVLFIELLDFYGQRFHYDRVGIDIRGLGKYVPRTSQNGPKGFRNMLQVDDPEDPMNNITRGSFNMPAIKRTLKHNSDVIMAACYEFHARDVNSRKRHRDDESEKKEQEPTGTYPCHSLLRTIVFVQESMLELRRHLVNVAEEVSKMGYVCDFEEDVAEKCDIVYVDGESSDEDDQGGMSIHISSTTSKSSNSERSRNSKKKGKRKRDETEVDEDSESINPKKKKKKKKKKKQLEQ